MKKKSAAPAAEKRSELFYSGRDCRAFDYMGAHPFVQDGEQGYLFRVYAPEAEKVSVMGEFNDWNRNADYMTRDEQGIWEKFIPNIPEYAAYKYSVWAKSGDVFDKSDPYGFHFETRPGNATKAYDLDGYEWGALHLPHRFPLHEVPFPYMLLQSSDRLPVLFQHILQFVFQIPWSLVRL